MWYVEINDLEIDEALDYLLDKHVYISQVGKEFITLSVDVDGDNIDYRVPVKFRTKDA